MAKKGGRRGVNFKRLFEHGVDIECDDLLKFIETMAGGLQSELTNFESFLDRVTANLDEDRRNEAIEFYSDDAFGLMERFPRIMWQAVFTSLYSFFEQEMNDICRRVRRNAEKKNVQRVRVAKTNAVRLPGQKCLSEFKIRLATKSPEWHRMVNYVGVRNLIVHNRGQLREDDDESDRVKRHVRYSKYVTIGRRNTLVLEREYCVRMVETMRAILNQVIDAIPNKLFQS